jgi:hypothetical protein
MTLDYLLGSSWVIHWLVAGLRPCPDFTPCFAARLASSRNVFAIAACFFAFSGSGFCFARSSSHLDTFPCADRGPSNAIELLTCS